MDVDAVRSEIRRQLQRGLSRHRLGPRLPHAHRRNIDVRTGCGGRGGAILGVNPSYQSPTRMKQLLCATAHDIGDSREGCGRLDIYRAMATALSDPSPPSSG